MALTPEQKRERRASASQQQRDDEAARKRKRRKEDPHQEHAARKRRRKPFVRLRMPAMTQANAALDAAARRDREYRERLTAAAMAAHVLPGDKTMTEHHAAVEIVTRLSWHCGSPRPGAVM